MDMLNIHDFLNYKNTKRTKCWVHVAMVFKWQSLNKAVNWKTERLQAVLRAGMRAQHSRPERMSNRLCTLGSMSTSMKM